MSVIVTYFGSEGAYSSPLNDSGYLAAYASFFSRLRKEGFTPYIVRGDAYQGAMQFSSAYSLSNEGVITELEHPISADLIFTKSYGILSQLSPSDIVVNPLGIPEVTHDKWKTYQRFSNFMPRTFEIDASNWNSVISQIKTEKVVLKPLQGYAGNGIVILPTHSARFEDLPLSVPYLAQEFVDTSGGIPGITPGHHDLRVIISGKTNPLISFARVPQSGKLIANFAQGGSILPINTADIPQSVQAIAWEVDRSFENLGPRFYAIDFMLEQGKPYICELNSQPGLPFPSDEGESFCATYMNNLVAVFKEKLSHS